MPDESDSANSAPQTGKVISLRGHQAAEQAVDDLLITRRQDPRFISLVAKAFSLGSPLLSAVVRRLDAERPVELLVLAEVAGRYPGRGQAVRALIRAANDRRSSDARRLGAALALGMYDYGVILPPLHDFLAGLAYPSAAFSSAVMRAIDAYAHSRAPQEWELLCALFLGQPPEILFSVVGTVTADQSITTGEAASVLRVLALNPHPEVMAAAVESLASRSDADSVRALAVLQANLPPDVAHTVARQLQKLRLSGSFNPDPPNSPAPGLNAHLSALDGKGRRLLTLRWPGRRTGERARVIELMLSDTQGIIDAAMNPPDSTVGDEANGVPHAPHHPLYGEQASHRESLVDVPFSYCLRLLRSFVRLNWSSGTSLPVAYILEAGAIWESASEMEDEWAATLPDRSGADTETSGEDESALLSHPAFAGWYLDTPATHMAAQEIAVSSGGLSRELTDENWRILLPSIIRLSHDEFVPEMRSLYANRLQMMAEWLHLSGQPGHAALASSAAYTMTHSPPEANLFVLRLVQKGVLVALGQL